MTEIESVNAPGRLLRLGGLLLGLLFLGAVACASDDVSRAAVTEIVSDNGEYAFHGLDLEPIEAAPDFTLTDQHGQSFTLGDQEGKAVLLFFGYTSCPDVCPTTLADFVQVRRALGDDADNVAFVFITVDPERDSHEVIKRYLGRFDDSFIGLRGEGEVLEAVKLDYGVFSAPELALEGEDEHADTYLVSHSSFAYLIDRTGQLLVFYPFGTMAPEMIADVKHLVQ
jgi:protein SCO1/2